MLPETIAEIVKIEQVIGVKEATGSLERTAKVIELVGDKVAVYSGDDATAYETILQGGKGNISVTANVAPALMHELRSEERRVGKEGRSRWSRDGCEKNDDEHG